MFYLILKMIHGNHLQVLMLGCNYPSIHEKLQ